MTFRMPRTAVALIVAGLALTGCTSDSESKGGATAKGDGGGTAVVTVGETKHEIPVTCTVVGQVHQAAGTKDKVSTTLIVTGERVSVVLVEQGDDGVTVAQASKGLRDGSGKAVGDVTIKGEGNTYSGTGTFVITKVGRDGKRIEDPSAASPKGSFELTCLGGFVPPSPAPSATPSTSPSS